MGYAIIDENNVYVGAWSRWDNPPRPLAGGESVVESEWDAENNRPLGVTLPTPPTPVVQQISRRQGRLLLHQMGLLEQVEAAITATGKVAEIFYEAEVWLRSDAFVNSLGLQLGLTSEQLDEMFNSASTL